MYFLYIPTSPCKIRSQSLPVWHDNGGRRRKRDLRLLLTRYSLFRGPMQWRESNLVLVVGKNAAEEIALRHDDVFECAYSCARL